MDELREKIARAVQEQLWADPDGASETFQHDVADRILAIPEIDEALRGKPGRVITSYLTLDQNALAEISEQLEQTPSPKL